jgi:TRAP-type C4-dicarboxylate transport system substrate-binding protein
MVLAVSVVSASAKEKVYKWRAQTYAVPGSVGYKAAEIALANLKKATNGRLDIKIFCSFFSAGCSCGTVGNGFGKR